MNKIKLFENKKVRTHWDRQKGEWYFSVVDVCEVLSGSVQPRKYWSDLKVKLKLEGSEVSDKIGQLKMTAEDGKMRLTDVLDTRGIFRLIQSIPSPKAEPFKMWLAEVGNDRIEEIYDPEKAIQRALNFYRKKGHDENWINQRIKTIEMRKELTDEWQRVGIKHGIEFAILTDEMTKAWTNMTTREYKDFKDLTKENLRDNMTNLELVLNLLAEQSTKFLSENENPTTFKQSKQIAKKGGEVARGARESLEKQGGRSVLIGGDDRRAKNEN